MIRIVLHSLATRALQSLLHLEVEDEAWIASLGLLLGLHDLVEEILVVFSSVLLLTGLELRMTLADQVLENSRPDTILIVLIFGERRSFLLLRHLIVDHLLSQLLLAVLAREQTERQFSDLSLEALRRELITRPEMLFCAVRVLSHEVRL